ncbi:hypothetical protein EJ04DRAFT_556991 [Polyplosphaeria fusca]|uniref:Uncharacterized protein n=1 Tax=Polyplosphaeria fusca TaxID=682080 RepID=A0A9P4QNF3_9PLEO|nr:hypothetical protein EJ04DRAFT_556991 [Polyplosphaeria fusca]
MDRLSPGNGVGCPTPQQIFTYIGELSKSEHGLNRFGTFSPALYDSAWLSMVYTRDGASRFPQCFAHILASQKEDGTWTSYGSQIDGILNTLAALLAMFERRKRIPTEIDALDGKINSAKSGLHRLLEEWDVESTVHVGFEILVTSILRQLQSFGVQFAFPGRALLESVYERKMQKFSPRMVYGTHQMTILHSVEALAGVIEFDMIKHHCTKETGIMASPAATAAYLIYSTEWDVRAEHYLESVLSAYGNSGEVPSAFPTPIFEISWTLSNLLSHSTEELALDAETVSKISALLRKPLESQGGIVGFAPGLLPDADDTARTLMTLKRLGVPIDCAPMVKKFENGDHFRTYELERNPSVSANCNVLLALLESETADEHVPEIVKILTFLLTVWSSGEVPDKWNVSPQYTSMLMVEAFVSLLKRYNSGVLQSLPAKIVRQQIPVALSQILLRTLSSQREDGSWSSSLEETSYSIITISECTSLPFNDPTIARLTKAVELAQSYLKAHYATDPSNHYFWVEKTTYQSYFLKIAYCSMALYTQNSSTSYITWTPEIISAFDVPTSHSKKIAMLLTSLPIFRASPLASPDLVLLEAMHAAKDLRKAQNTIMQRDEIGFTKDKYLEYIPVIWLACNHIGGHALKDSVIKDMLLLSLLNYQIDEYMESVVSKLSPSSLSSLSTQIFHECGLHQHFSNPHPTIPPPKRRKLSTSSTTNDTFDTFDTPHSEALTPILSVLRRYTSHILTHPSILLSPPWLRLSLALELHNYLLAQLSHNADNASLSASPSSPFTPRTPATATYHKWVHSTGADDTSCPFSWHFFIALMSAGTPGTTCLDGMVARYAAEAMVRGLAVLCRMYNDFGSVGRDREEGNLNSVDFEELSGQGEEGEGRKAVLMRVAEEVERRGVEGAWGGGGGETLMPHDISG